MSGTDKTLLETLKALNGFDELAIEARFGKDLSKLMAYMPMATRAAIFCLKRREGLKDAEAYKQAMELPLSEVDDFFAEEPEDLDPSEPDSDAGKESSPNESGTLSSPRSASSRASNPRSTTA